MAEPRQRRVLYFIVRYPTFSETYMHEEIRSVRDRYEVDIVTYALCIDPRQEPFPYHYVPYLDTCLVYGKFGSVNRDFSSLRQRFFLDRIDRLIEEFRPDVMHAHYFGLALLLDNLSQRHGIPYTLRTHSMDVLSEPEDKLKVLCETVSRPACLRVLTFPRFRETLLRHGASSDRLVDCWPVLNFGRFATEGRASGGRRVMCAGPAIRKKRHGDFVDLAARMRGSGFSFELYARGPSLLKTRAHNLASGSPVQIAYVDPDQMPAVYREHDWLVYPSDPAVNKVGLPVSIVEAQAAGLGVCWQELPGRRDEQLEFLGGAGLLFQSIDEVPALLEAGYPEAMRARGLENARKCDIQGHRHLLTEAWDAVAL